MKYIKIAIASIFGAACLCSCEGGDKTPTGPGTGVVEFGETEVLTKENAGLFTIPLVLTGEPGGYPVTVRISAESPKDDINDLLYITSTTIKITEDNNSFVQMKPVLNSEDSSDYEVTLTIENVTGANIGAKSQCTVFIENSLAPKLGQYNFTATAGNPDTWTLIIREGSNGTYVLENFFGMDIAPKMVGVYDEATNTVILDGRINGKGPQSYFMYPGLGTVGDDGELLLIRGSGNGLGDVIFNVNDKMELESTSSSFQLIAYDQSSDKMRDLASFNGGSLQFAGDNTEKPWPFD